ncbi:hypothetical protein [Crenothrix polyspora]|uniref:DUF86 domain-containing protein n=1 Tax=Crenothrix polyspora TaxID=360316 RepID=A0A1R4GZ78_9GAMM|nr:hypothetical protein [Crenothrix polyspora]SJM89275.1 hypothetical protein CRENPOLYSF1_1000009 [Crenothrix polyspora]
MSKELTILLRNYAACAQRIAKLAYSLNKNLALFPLTVESAKHLTDEQEESIDALILRYSQSVAMMQDHLFRGIAYVEQEDVSDKSNRDKTLLMEKLGAIRSADEFGTAAILRNKFSHHYPEEADVRIERLNLVIQEAEFVMDAFQDITSFLKRRAYFD